MRSNLPIVVSLFVVLCACGKNPSLPSSDQCFLDFECPTELGKPMERHCEGISSRENSDEITRVHILNASNAHRLLNSPPQELQWKSIGPYAIETSPRAAGRMISIAIDPANANHWFAGSAAGGIFESDNEGSNWRPITGNPEIPLMGIGAIAIHPTSPEIIYAGTGEPYLSGDAYGGLGLLLSLDGGKNWALLSDAPFAGKAVSDIVLDPIGPAVVLVGASDSNLPASEKKTGDSGIFLSSDYGGTWQAALKGANISDLEKNSQDPRSIYAGGIDNKYNASLWRSKDGGRTFALITTPFNVSGWHQKVMLASSQTNPNVLYASVGGDKLEGLWKSTNAWSDEPTFEKIDTVATGEKGYCGSQCWYSHVIAVSRTDENVLYAGGISLWRYDGQVWTDMGRSQYVLGTLHADQHALLVTLQGFPLIQDRIIATNDGGIYESPGDVDNAWFSQVEGLNVTQFWSGSISEDGKYVIGGTQDNGTAVAETLKIDPSDTEGGWREVIGSDGFDAIAGTPRFPDLWIGTTQHSGIYVSNNTAFKQVTKGIPENSKSPFVTRVAQCPFDGNRVIANAIGGVLSSTNLFSDDPSWNFQPGHAGGTKNSTSLAFSSNDDSCQSYAYGMDDGTVHSTFDGGITWQSYFPDGCSGRISDIEFSYFPNQLDPNISEVFFVAYSGFKSDHVVRVACNSLSPYETSEIDCEGSKAVTSLRFPVDIPVLGFEIDPRTDTLFAATDSSVWMLRDATLCESDSCQWTNFGFEQGIPNLPVFDVSVAAEARKVVAFTHGRGAYIMDISSLCPLCQ